MDRLSPLDASFLHMEDDVNHMHIGSVGILEGPPPAYSELVATIAGRLALVPRYRQRVATVPLSLARPVWVDDPHFNVEYHVRHTALPAPGGEEQLRRLVGRVMSQGLDRTKPMWEIWMVEGLDDDRWSLISKVHHCLVDGVSGTELLSLILDMQPEPPEPIDEDWHADPVPSPVQLTREAATGLLTSPYEQVRAVGAVLRRPRRLLDSAREVAKGSLALSSLVRPTPPTSLDGPIGPHRRYMWAHASLDEIKTVRVALGGTVNDVVLAMITRGFRDLLQARGEAVEDRTIRTLVPVSVRPRGLSGAAEGDGTLANKVSAMFAELPVNLDDPVERLHQITAQLDNLKQSKQALAGEAITSLSGFAPAMLLSLGMRVATRAASRMGNLDTVTTNVPGPQFPLYSCGRRLLRACPYVPLAAPVRVGVAIFSYDGEVTFGITGDYDTASDIDVLTDGIIAGLHELLASAGHGADGERDTAADRTVDGAGDGSAVTPAGAETAVTPTSSNGATGTGTSTATTRDAATEAAATASSNGGHDDRTAASSNGGGDRGAPASSSTGSTTTDTPADGGRDAPLSAAATTADGSPSPSAGAKPATAKTTVGTSAGSTSAAGKAAATTADAVTPAGPRSGAKPATAKTSAGTRTAGTKAVATKTARAKTAKAKTATSKSAGAKAAATKSAKTAKPNAADVKTAGAKPAGAKSAGTKTASARSGGTKTAGASTAGNKSSRAKST